MSSPAEADDEDEVEFVSEAPLRPVLECIDLLSDGEAEGGLPTADMIEDELDRRKAHVASTLDRLAQQVAVEKRERAEKCRAFKERQLSQKIHGQRELACSPGQGDSYDAKRCVDMWLKMPGAKPGVLNTGTGWRRRSEAFPTIGSSTHTCPVINCRRVYDNTALLEGHLKRFDHSPCDPTITLRGSPSERFACVACGLDYPTQERWNVHLQSKVSSSSPEGHALTQSCQVIVCFACPACCLLFYIRDECLQHMAAENHFSESASLSGDDAKVRAMPVPIPRYAKNRLISLCKDVAFRVRCSICRKVLNSHMEAKAHFNVQCRQGCAAAEADQTLAEVMGRLRAHSRCAPCSEVFLSPEEAELHAERTQHRPEVIRGADRALLYFSSHWEARNHAKRAAGGPDASGLARRRAGPEGSPAKRKRVEAGDAPKRARGARGGGGGQPTLAWFCECGLRFSEEAAAGAHILAANRIFHQCGVCGKQMAEAAIARLHMSRFHGGAHLANFLFHCRRCNVDMLRHQDILAHVAEAHDGHAYFSEREVVPEVEAAVPDAKPSTSGGGDSAPSSDPGSRRPPNARPRPASQPAPTTTWVCRMCEDVFASEAAAHAHCRDPAGHSFQRLVCGHCPQRFFKDATLRRHCASEHAGKVARRFFFCGLCDGMRYDTEDEFLEHYGELHGKDYYRLDEPVTNDAGRASATVAPGDADLAPCPCMASQKSRQERKAAFTLCMKRLGRDGACRYACAPCGESTSSYARIRTHVVMATTQHAELGLGRTFDVECRGCGAVHSDVPGFHEHYHAHHCPLLPCLGARAGGKASGATLGGEEGGESSSGGGCGGETSSHTGYRTEEAEAAPPSGRTLNGVEIKPAVKAEEMEDVNQATPLNPGEIAGGAEDRRDDCDEEMKRALDLSVQEARETGEFDVEPGDPDIPENTFRGGVQASPGQSASGSEGRTYSVLEMEEALQRSILDF